MPEEKSGTYLDQILLQRSVWESKPVLRTLYHRWYEDCVAWFSPLRPVLEVGAGSGNFKQFFPEAIASDAFAGGDWIDLVMDAQRLALKPNTVGNLLAFDLIHHLPCPLEFLKQAVAALKPGGRLVACEPAVSLWSRFVYRAFHHEDLDMSYDAFRQGALPQENDPARTFANQAIPELLFFRHRERALRVLQSTKVIAARKFAFLLYPLSGGYNHKSLLPQRGLTLLMRIEDMFTRVVPGGLIGLRMLVVLEKRAS
jgi:SAM-dependent methyltransferase